MRVHASGATCELLLKMRSIRISCSWQWGRTRGWFKLCMGVKLRLRFRVRLACTWQRYEKDSEGRQKEKNHIMKTITSLLSLPSIHSICKGNTAQDVGNQAVPSWFSMVFHGTPVFSLQALLHLPNHKSHVCPDSRNLIFEVIGTSKIDWSDALQRLIILRRLKINS